MTGTRNGQNRSRGRLALLLLSLAGCETPGTCTMGRATELPLILAGEHLVAPVQIDGKAAAMVLDSGSSNTLLTERSVARLQLPTPEFTDARISGFGGSRGVSILQAAHFKLGDMQGTDLHIGVLIGRDVLREEAADGILGMDLLAQTDLDFDLPEHKMILYHVVSGCSQPSAVLDPPLYSLPMIQLVDERRAVVEVRIFGQKLRALLDSGSPGSVIYRRAARRIGLDEPALAGDPEDQIGGIGKKGVRMRTHITEAVEVGDLTIKNLRLGVLDDNTDDQTDMVLGLDFFLRTHLWLSFSSRTVIVQFPPRASPA